MTDKRITIDGVDVSGCEKYKHEIARCNATLKNMCFCGGRCTDKKNANCYYKQLKRKEQECEALKQILTEIKEIVKNMNNECFYSDFDCKDCDMKNGCTYFNKKQILQK